MTISGFVLRQLRVSLLYELKLTIPLKGLRYVPRVIITDKLRSYSAAKLK